MAWYLVQQRGNFTQGNQHTTKYEYPCSKHAGQVSKPTRPTVMELKLRTQRLTIPTDYTTSLLRDITLPLMKTSRK